MKSKNKVNASTVKTISAVFDNRLLSYAWGVKK